MNIKIAHTSLNKALEVLGYQYGSDAAKLEVLAIGGQESKYLSRRQLISKNGKLVPQGPATGFWQFERGGGVTGVLNHERTSALAKRLCAVRDVAPTSQAVWEALERDDVLAAGFARLLLLADRGALPAVGDEKAAWACYIKNWRPGKPHPEYWPAAYNAARKELGI